VTGELGGSLAGKHLDFEPRLAEAEWLTGNFAIHAMIDLSDGLAGDLRHVLKASNVGAELLSDAIPISRAARSQASLDAAPSEPPPAEASADAATELPPARPPRKAPLIAALTDGEDFELLLTAAGRDAVPLLDAWRARFPDLRLTCIGKITSEPGLRVRDRKGLKTLDLHGYAHFE
jgi:thiamine-monophosphate kinase